MAEIRPLGMDGLEVGGVELRMAMEALDEGVLSHDSLRPSLGAGNTVDIAVGRGVVQGDFSVLQGKYWVANDATKNSAAFEGGGIPAAAAQPAVHQIVAKVWDPAYEAVGVNGRRWRLMVAAGAPAAGASLSNRTGAANLAADPWRNAMPICDVLRNPDGSIAIQDRRIWAGGKVQNYVNALPVGTAPHGMEINLQTDISPTAYGGPYNWRLRYRALNPDLSPSGSLHKWEVVSARGMYQRSTPTVTTLSATSAALSGAPSMVMPYIGVYRAMHGFDGFIGSATASPSRYADQRVFLNGAAVTSPLVAAGTPNWTSVSGSLEFTVVGVGHVAEVRQSSASGDSTATFSDRFLEITPLRIG